MIIFVSNDCSAFLSSYSGQALDRFTFLIEDKERVPSKSFQRLSSLDGHFRFSMMSSYRDQVLDRFTLLIEHKKSVPLISLQRFSDLNGLFRFSYIRRNYDISLFQKNTKSVFYFKSSNISVFKRSFPPFLCVTIIRRIKFVER